MDKHNLQDGLGSWRANIKVVKVVLGRFGSFWVVLGYFESVWAVLGSFGSF